MTKKGTQATSSRPNSWRIAAWTLAALLWLLPLAAMQVSAEVNWTASDFVFAGVLIGGVGMAVELTLRSTRNLAYRLAMGLHIAATFLLIWINAAVGIIGNEDNPLNLLYGGVLAIAYGGALVAGFRARGMASAMAAAVVAQAIVGIVAVVAGGSEHPGPVGQIVLNGFFLTLFAGSALLFRKAAKNA